MKKNVKNENNEHYKYYVSRRSIEKNRIQTCVLGCFLETFCARLQITNNYPLTFNISIPNQLFIYKSLLVPYGLTASHFGASQKIKYPNDSSLPTSICLHIVNKAPWCVTHKLLPNGLLTNLSHPRSKIQTSYLLIYKRFHEHHLPASQLASKIHRDNITWVY